MKILIDTDTFIMEKGSSLIPYVRKLDASLGTQWQVKLEGTATGEMALDASRANLYVRYYNTITNDGFIIGIDASTGSVNAAYKG